MNELMKKGKNVMKTTKIKVIGYRLMVIVMLAILPALAEAVEFKNSYGGYRPTVGGSFGSTYRATAPTVSFQSTSAYSDQWGDAGVSMLNADGSVNTEAYMGGDKNNAKVGPRRVTGTPGGNPDDEYQQPIGDALFPLLLFAAGYAVYRRRKTRTLGY